MKNIFVIILLIIFSIGIGGVYLSFQKKEVVRVSNISGESMIGGDFTLIDQNGETVYDSDFRGRLMLVFFGFTHCPNICPTDLFIMSQVMKNLDKNSGKLAPIFITIDPERDTSVKLKGYLENFHPSLIGLTGSAEQIQKVTQAYKVYYSKVEEKNSDLEYNMDHSTFMYLMDYKGGYLTHFSHNTEVMEIVNTIKKYIR